MHACAANVMCALAATSRLAVFSAFKRLRKIVRARLASQYVSTFNGLRTAWLHQLCVFIIIIIVSRQCPSPYRIRNTHAYHSTGWLRLLHKSRHYSVAIYDSLRFPTTDNVQWLESWDTFSRSLPPSMSISTSRLSFIVPHFTSSAADQMIYLDVRCPYVANSRALVHRQHHHHWVSFGGRFEILRRFSRRCTSCPSILYALCDVYFYQWQNRTHLFIAFERQTFCDMQTCHRNDSLHCNCQLCYVAALNDTLTSLCV